MLVSCSIPVARKYRTMFPSDAKSARSAGSGGSNFCASSRTRTSSALTPSKRAAAAAATSISYEPSLLLFAQSARGASKVRIGTPVMRICQCKQAAKETVRHARRQDSGAILAAVRARIVPARPTDPIASPSGWPVR